MLISMKRSMREAVMRAPAEETPTSEWLDEVIGDGEIHRHRIDGVVEPSMPEPLIEPIPEAEPEPVMHLEPENEPEELMAEPEPVLDLDDLDTPAYLRRGRMLN